jgi:choline dehydrogenase-like flavoprotein
MILTASDIAGIDLLSADVVVVGAGPAGIVLALELVEQGLDVIVVESGLVSYSEDTQYLSEAGLWQTEIHARMTMAVRRQVGGTSVIWGGRCVPYDPVDFDNRDLVGDAAWPIGYGEISSYHQRACDWMQCGRAVFDAEETGHLPKSVVPGLHNGDMRTSALERWSLPTNFGTEYRTRLEESSRVRIVTGFTATELVAAGDGAGKRTEAINACTLDGQTVRLRGRAYVVAAGGLESTRLLMASRGLDGNPIGDHSGHLGRWYMSHVEGVVSDIVFRTPPRQTVFDYERDIDGVYVRRRFTFADEFIKSHDLPNIAAWIANPGLADAAHESGPLSFVYLALESPLGRRFAPDAQRLSLTGRHVPGSPYGPTERSPLREHLKNIADQPIETARFVASFGLGRFLPRKRRMPGFFVHRPSNRYPFQYHAEHLPNPMSRVTLGKQRDQLGMPRIDINLAFSDSDVEGVVRAHSYWDSLLRAQGVGHLEYHQPDIADVVRSRAGGGFHQIGTTRMSRRPEDGVVDGNLAIHGYPNTYVLSSSSFVTSSQANSTFLLVALAVRLGEHLGKALAN